jgi:16S rRNA (uracil1498-N3)-methyltransferase
MHRFYLAPKNCLGPSLRLDEHEAHHALHVLRLKPGDSVTVLDGVGHIFLCHIESTTRETLALSVGETKTAPALPCPLTLFVAIPKGKIIEDIIEKSVELGVQEIVPLLSERVVTQLDSAGAEAKREKWQQVAVEAIKQCGAAWLPRVAAPAPLASALARQTGIELPLVGSLQTERRHPHDWIHEFHQAHGRLPASACVWIGPEGDFTLDELAAIEAAGAKPITLGDLTLRVETAAVYCLSFLNYELRRPSPHRPFDPQATRNG